MAEKKTFRQVLVKALDQGVSDGTITRWDALRVRLAMTLRPKVVEELMSACAAMAADAGLCSAADAQNYAFDWMTLFAWILENLPAIIALFT